MHAAYMYTVCMMILCMHEDIHEVDIYNILCSVVMHVEMHISLHTWCTVYVVVKCAEKKYNNYSL